MKNKISYSEVSKILIETCGGVCDSELVYKPAVVVLKLNGCITDNCAILLDKLNIPATQTVDNRLAELCARLTYLTFNSSPEYDPKSYHEILTKLEHTSPYYVNDTVIGMFGIHVETSLEIVSSWTNSSARCTSSNTLAMCNPLYSVTDRTVQATKKFLEFKRSIDITGLTLEESNMFSLSSKATYLISSMTTEEWINIANSRIKDAGEQQTTEIYKRIKGLLNENNI